MGYNLGKRISLLKQQTDESLEGRIALPRAFFLSLVGFALCSWMLGSILPSSRPAADLDIEPPESPSAIDAEWIDQIEAQFKESRAWLSGSFFVITPKAADIYEAYARGVVTTLRPSAKHDKEARSIDIGIDIFAYIDGARRRLASALLRLGFLVIAFTPWWIICAAAGYYGLRNKFQGKRTDDILGVCDRGNGPFYSGIYGPLRPNNSFSGTDYSAPNLACPAMVPETQASAHKLGAVLKQYRAATGTNMDLLRIILSYKHFPGRVESEQSWEDDNSAADTTDHLDIVHVSNTGISTNADGTLEESAIEGLASVLQAHDMLCRYVELMKSNNVLPASLNGNYQGYITNLKKFGETLNPLSKLLAFSLTPNRAWALSNLPPAMVASAYLAIEAGKCLVYKPAGKGFVRISHFPHLQARAVLQSLPVYHKEYNGDQRLIMRQAIICSRRHGDFGMAFLPIRMPVESRALRDWLEIMYAEPEKREGIAQLVELDSQVEEISVNFRSGFGRRVRQEFENPVAIPDSASPAARFWRGIAHKSVVLVPLTELIPIALRGMDEGRLERILQLIALTRRYQTSLSISARLPGFKRQAVEAQKLSSDSKNYSGRESYNKELLEKWAIVRRMLTRYNWLSTRVGDDAVPADGFVQGVIYQKQPGTDSLDMFGLDALVPLRQRRFEELFGKTWESHYYSDSPHPTNVHIFVDTAEFWDAVKDGKSRPGVVAQVTNDGSARPNGTKVSSVG